MALRDGRRPSVQDRGAILMLRIGWESWEVNVFGFLEVGGGAGWLGGVHVGAC